MDYRNPTEPFLRSIDIHTLLPQQEPFVMIGTLTHFEMSTITTELTIPADNIFVNDGRFSAAGMIENIAQTCAARLGYINKYILLRGIQLGYIGAIRDLRVNALPHVGDTITTTVTVQSEIFGMLLATAVITDAAGQPLVTTEMKIAVRDAE